MGAIERHEANSGARRLPWTGRARPAVPDAPRPVVGMPVTIEHGGVRWINIETPTPVSVAYLRENFAYHEPDLEDVLDMFQRPKFDEYDDYLMLVLQFPVYSKLTHKT